MRNHVQPNSSFERAALFQAKKLYRSGRNDLFHTSDKFEAFDLVQLQRLHDLERQDGLPRFCQYLFYCPRPDAYDPPTLQRIEYYLTPPDDAWHGYWPLTGAWLSLLLRRTDSDHRHVPGMLSSDIDWLVDRYLPSDIAAKRHGTSGFTPPSVNDIFEHLWYRVVPFSWFLVLAMIAGRAGSSKPKALAVARGTDLNATVLPRYVLTIQIALGTEQ